MPDQKLNALSESIDESREALDDAETAAQAGDDDAAVDALAEVRARLDGLQAAVDALQAEVVGVAGRVDEVEKRPSDLPPELRQLADDLAEAERAERGPNREHHRYRRIV